MGLNMILMASVTAWGMAQFTKVIVGLTRYGSDDKHRILWRIIWAGGMPSAHSAIVSASTLVIFLTVGGANILFGLSLVVACIVIYDRSRMHNIYCRFQETYPGLKQAVQEDPLLNDLVGHRLSEIFVGILIGLGSGYAVMQLMPDQGIV